MKWWIWPLISAFIVAAWVIYDHNRMTIGSLSHTTEDVKIIENEWKVVQVAESPMVIRVEWDQKYGGTKITYCKVLFQNASQYKLIAPGINEVIEKSNLNNIRYTKCNPDEE